MLCRRSPVAMGMPIFRCDERHFVEVVGRYGVLVEEGMVGFDAAAEDDSFAGGKAAVDLDAEVDVAADCLAVGGDGLDGVFDHVDVGLEVGEIAAVVEEGGEVPDGGEAACSGVGTAGDQLFLGFAEDVIVDAGFVAHFSAEKLVGGHAEVLAGDIPEGDVDGAERAHDGGAAEVAPAVEVLPVVLDAQGILADQIALEGFDGAG